MRRPWVLGNWKMHGDVAGNLLRLQALSTQDCAGIDVAIAPPLIYFAQAQAILAGSAVKLAAQEVSAHEQGAWTGQHAASMLRDFDCELVLAGHSECRQQGRSDEEVGQQLRRILEQGLRAVLCVGETLAEYEAGLGMAVVRRQLQSLFEVPEELARRALIAYEPVWAIGTGQVATPEHAQTVHQAIRACVAQRSPSWAQALPVLYGGSVKVDNVASLMSQADVDGVLVGGASLKAGEFIKIIELSRQAKSVPGTREEV